MIFVHAIVLISLAVASVPAIGEEMDHSTMDHSQMDQAASNASARKPLVGHDALDNAIHSYLLFDQLEVRDSEFAAGIGWDLTGWVGTDLNRIWIRSEGEVVSGNAQAADFEVLYGRSVSPWWNLVSGLRHDFRPGESQTFAAVGIQGLAPQRIEMAATLYLGDGGQTAARASAECDWLFTNRLVLQPRVEVDLYGKTDVNRDIGSGLTSARVGMRLRYEVTRQFAPYIGLDWDRTFGKTAELKKAAQGGVSQLRAVVGVRAWF